MPELTDLALEFNEVGDAGLAALRPLLAGRLTSRLRRLGIGTWTRGEEPTAAWKEEEGEVRRARARGLAGRISGPL